MEPKHYVATLVLIALSLSLPTRLRAAAPPTLLTEMARVEQTFDVSFVYDSALPLSQPYRGPGLPLQARADLGRCLRLLFSGTGIGYRREQRLVLLFPSGSQRHTLSGRVTDASGEPLISATVFCPETGEGTTTNAQGFFSLTLPSGRRRLRYSFVGFRPLEEQLDLTADLTHDVSLGQDSLRVAEVVVEGDLNSPLLTTQTGRRTLTPGDLQREFALMSSPDLVKSLQGLSGVAVGVELASGLYVHGGNADENLFLLDGTPLYQTNHMLGLFSSFNTDMVKHVDFYKSGFPARYGGRLSSVVDVRTADGDMHAWHGRYTIGTIDGRVQVEGPIVRDRTSINVGLRRSWADLAIKSGLAVARLLGSGPDDDDQTSFSLFFHDFNAKLTHKLSQRDKLQLNFYSGTDAFGVEDEWHYAYGRNVETEHDRLSWGNTNASLDWQHLFSPRLFSNITATYTHNRTHYRYGTDRRAYGTDSDKPLLIEQTIADERYSSTIDDIGLRADFDYRPSPRHHVRYGGAFTHHRFRPQQLSDYFRHYDADQQTADTTGQRSAQRQLATEMSLYAESETRLSPRWSVNVGAHADAFAVSGRTFVTIDPRLAAKWQATSRTSVKASYTWMTQHMHRMQSTYIDMPTDFWVPTTRRLSPMRSQQLSVGLYTQLSPHWLAVAEVYHRRQQHLLRYSGWLGAVPPADRWDSFVDQGDGRSTGLDLDLGYRSRRLSLDAAYTLSRTERRFLSVGEGWFPDKFDNRHKLSLTARIHWRRTEMYASWLVHSGNRITVPLHYMAEPDALPAVKAMAGYALNGRFFYGEPNNVAMPTYHRLDLGWSFHHTTKHRHERIWNVSIYNAYCHLNPLFCELETQPTRVRTTGYIPIIPSVSYTIKF